MASTTLAGVPASRTAPHVHFQCCVIDGVFAAGQGEQVQFREAAALTSEDLATVQQQVRARVLRWFARAGHLEPADARDMAGWHHGGGFSLNASVRIEGADRAGLERLLPWLPSPRRGRGAGGEGTARARRSRWSGSSKSATTSSSIASPSREPDGRTELRLSPLELIERVAA